MVQIASYSPRMAWRDVPRIPARLATKTSLARITSMTRLISAARFGGVAEMTRPPMESRMGGLAYFLEGVGFLGRGKGIITPSPIVGPVGGAVKPRSNLKRGIGKWQHWEMVKPVGVRKW